MRTACRHPSGLAAKAFAPASCFPSSLRRVTFSQIQRICEKVRLGVSKAAWEQHRLGEAASLIESLKSKAHLIIDARNGKNLTDLQSRLLFKDSRNPS